jgi:hypothetical protein
LPAGLSLDGETGVISGTFSGSDGNSSSVTFKAIDTGGNFLNKAINFIANAAPVWTTAAGEITGGKPDDAFSFQLVASGGSAGGALTYTLQSGSLSTGLSLSTSGLIAGTPTDNGVLATFTIRVTDQQGLSADREFNLTFTGSLYDFSSATFTPGGATGRFGPNISQARGGIGNPSWASTYLNMSTNGIQKWTVPASGSYRITVGGARGGIGASGYSPGHGAQMAGTFSLISGDVLKIMIGQIGGTNPGDAGGGGGGSFVATNSNTPLIAAGGGAGSSYSTYLSVAIQNHGLSTIGDGSAGAALSFNDEAGAGFNEDAPTQVGTSAKSFINGGVGGQNGRSDGGFGGGGAGESSYPSGGGGGGYEGGDSGNDTWSTAGNGQGGKSYNDGTSQTSSSGSINGNGFVTIERI